MDMMHAFIIFILIIGCKAPGCKLKDEDLAKPHVDDVSRENWKKICKDEEKKPFTQDVLAKLYGYLKEIPDPTLNEDAAIFLASMVPDPDEKAQEASAGIIPDALAKEDIAARDILDDGCTYYQEKKLLKTYVLDNPVPGADSIKNYENICRYIDNKDAVLSNANKRQILASLLDKITHPQLKQDAQKFIDVITAKAIAEDDKAQKLDESMKGRDASLRHDEQPKDSAELRTRLEKSDTLVHQLAILQKEILDVPGDGNCFYHALSRQMKKQNIDDDDNKAVRAEAVKYLEQHRAQFEVQALALEIKGVTTYAEYIDLIRRDAVYADDLEISGASFAYDIRIIIYQQGRRPRNINAKGKDYLQCPDYKKCVEVAYTGGHYMQVIEMDPNRVNVELTQKSKSNPKDDGNLFLTIKELINGFAKAHDRFSVDPKDEEVADVFYFAKCKISGDYADLEQALRKELKSRSESLLLTLTKIPRSNEYELFVKCGTEQEDGKSELERDRELVDAVVVALKKELNDRISSGEFKSNDFFKFFDVKQVLSKGDNLKRMKANIEKVFKASLSDKDNVEIQIEKMNEDEQLDEYKVIVTYKASDSDKDIKEKENLEKQEKEDVPVEQSEEKQQKVNQIGQPKKEDALNAQNSEPKTEQIAKQEPKKDKGAGIVHVSSQKVRIAEADSSEDSLYDRPKDHADPGDSIIPRSEEEEEPRSSDKADEDKSRALPNIADVKNPISDVDESARIGDNPRIIVHEQPPPKVHTGVDKRIAASPEDLENVKKVINEIKVKGFPSVQFVPDSAKTLDDKDKHTMDFVISANEFSPERLKELETEIEERFKSIVEFNADRIKVTITKDYGSSNALRRLLAVRYRVTVSYIDRPSDGKANDGIDDDEAAQRRSSQNANNENNMIHIVAPKRKSKSNKSWWFWIIGAIAAVVVLLCCICVCCFVIIDRSNQNDHDRAYPATPPLPLHERDNRENERQNIRHRNLPLYEGDVV